MFRCQHCGHQLCGDELRKVEQEDWSTRVTLRFKCQGCGKRSSFPVAQRVLDHALRIEDDDRCFLRPGTLVNECQAQEMIKFERLGPITVDEAIEFAQALEMRGVKRET
jgi:hypothetical protein